MNFNVDQAMEILAATPGVLRAWLGNVSDEWARSNYGPDTFSPFDVVGHLIHGEKTDWIPRARMILSDGESRPFEPFDRYAMLSLHDETMSGRLKEFVRLRSQSLTELRDLRLTPATLDLTGRHPALGVVTLKQLLATWAVHDLNHVAQIAKAMSYQYKDAVGSWRDYLSILHDFPT